MRYLLWLFVSLVSVQGLPGGLWAQIHISGPQSGVLVGTTYIVDGDISVQSGDSLIIEPGAVFLFDGTYVFSVGGYLYAVGTEVDSIKFTPNTGIPAWEGIDFFSTASAANQLEFLHITGSTSSGIFASSLVLLIANSTIIENSADYGGGIHVTGTDLTVSGCQFSGNSAITGAGLYAADNASLELNGGSFFNNLAEQHGGGVYIRDGNGEITNSHFEGNRAESTIRGKGGGVSSENALVAVEGCTFTQNYAGLSGGGVGFVSSTGSSVKHSLFYDNSTPNQGGAIMLKWTSGRVENCTIDDNFSTNIGGAIHISRDSFLTLLNSTITNTRGPNAISIGLSSNSAITYNDIYGNEGDDFSGNVPAGAGLIIGVNANGDPCDDYFNIFLSPEYVNQPDRDYNLTSTSPCIDAGDPNSPQDPDGTVADIGAFYYDQGAPPLVVTLTPVNPPIQIPAGGGSFLYDIRVENSGATPLTSDVWIVAILPNGSSFGPLLLREGLTIPAGGVLERSGLSQSVPAGAPSGEYSYVANAGIYPGVVLASDSFNFEKLPGVDGSETISSWSMPIIKADNYNLLSAYPNPFNPTTVIRFNLPIAGWVRLEVFDVNGRNVGAVREPPLQNRWYSAGNHEITFDGSLLPAGIYFARLIAGNFRQTQRLLLVK